MMMNAANTVGGMLSGLLIYDLSPQSFFMRAVGTRRSAEKYWDLIINGGICVQHKQFKASHLINCVKHGIQ